MNIKFFFYNFKNRFFDLLSLLSLFNLIYGEQIKINLKNLLNTEEPRKNELPDGFMLVDENIPNGPITVDRENDDGTKRNIYKNIRLEDDSFYYNQNDFDKLNNTTPKREEYFCELKSPYRPEVLKGYDISCPKHYTIKIDKSFYGRYKRDRKNCIIVNNKKFSTRQIKLRENCGYEPTKYLKELCEDKEYCSIIPISYFFRNYCGDVSKYLHVEYHCQKDSQLKKESISIISFYNGINVNSMQEHSVSEFYQYANIHGYEFNLENINYAPGREIYFMKFYSVIEKIVEGLKYKKYDWILWVDSDVVILNPNIKLESFLPDDKMKKIHLIAGYDYWGDPNYCCGLNTGVLFIRVHEWSLNILMRAITYPYFNINLELLFPEQIALTNILIESNETDHYVIVPQQWFNNRHIKKGEFLFHIMGGRNSEKIKILHEFFDNNKNGTDWDLKTNEETRNEVLDYYYLPREKQISINIQPQIINY